MRPEPYQSLFELESQPAAKVSEISEATAASGIPSAERINFHIGNPVQDLRLQELYAKLAAGEEPLPGHLQQALQAAAAYVPRGGYVPGKPHPLIVKMASLLQDEEADGLAYQTGGGNSPRELIVANGGLGEVLRVLWHTLDRFQRVRPVEILYYGMQIPHWCGDFKNLHFNLLADDEEPALSEIKEALTENSSHPHYLLLARPLSEFFRRSVSQYLRADKLFAIESNGAPNLHSLAREAGLAEKVVRILGTDYRQTVSHDRATLFLAGPSGLLQRFENTHFELKGTPSGPELETALYQLSAKNLPDAEQQPVIEEDTFPAENVRRETETLATRVTERAGYWQQKIGRFADRAEAVVQRVATRRFDFAQSDPLSTASAGELQDMLLNEAYKADFGDRLREAFLQAFCRHHTFYKLQQCVVVSGSARTALGLLGFHCGIREVFTCDLSWTYQHCFPHSEYHPLTPDLQLDVEGMWQAVRGKIASAPNWPQAAAVVINNPHNATGQVFAEEDLKELLKKLLPAGVRVIDDLSYQNVAPSSQLPQIKTLKQLALELSRDGYLTRADVNHLITIHSLSKTDSFAGARLAVAEIPERELFERFSALNSGIAPNRTALVLAYLFYRNPPDALNRFWVLRNRIFTERMQAILEAVAKLPAERNPFALRIIAPTGSMYPRLEIGNLPPGVSLDWLAMRLATEGTGLVPLTTFARTTENYGLARNAFRLTLGGTAGKEQLAIQTRRLLIDLNRLLDLEAERFDRVRLKPVEAVTLSGVADAFFGQLRIAAGHKFSTLVRRSGLEKQAVHKGHFESTYLPERLQIFRQRLEDKQRLYNRWRQLTENEIKNKLMPRLRNEFYKEDLERRRTNFRMRLFDRTVHPTQMYALVCDRLFDRVADNLIANHQMQNSQIETLAEELAKEYLGTNVALSSAQESDELLGDLAMMADTEAMLEFSPGQVEPIIVSFWGDWDGSTRPSGQGHRLLAAVLLENIRRMQEILQQVRLRHPHLKIDSGLLQNPEQQSRRKRRIKKVFDRITALTAQLESRHRNMVRLSGRESGWKRWGRRLHLSKDPIEQQWQHNDRLEKRMQHLRNQRRRMLEEALALNKSLRKAILSLLPKLESHLSGSPLLPLLAAYRDPLKRFILTPRIHQNIITSEDPFAVDTTVENIMELNALGARFGNPGIVLGLQVSMSDTPQALIDLERKLDSRRQALQQSTQLPLPPVWCIPLFEEQESVANLPAYLDALWEYASRGRRLRQETADRFREILCEVFIAGSDLSQQVSQARAAQLYNEAKYTVFRWLGAKGLPNGLRVKLGSGEPMQRQGGYFDALGGKPAFQMQIKTNGSLHRTDQQVAIQAAIPIRGVLAGGDLRTFQSNLMEQIRFLSLNQRAELMAQLRQNQVRQAAKVTALSQPLFATRLQYQGQSEKALRKIARVSGNPHFQRFLEINQKAFRQILYGSKEDTVGLHIISYFISRAVPTLRDRPTVRPLPGGASGGLRIVDRLAKTLPLANHGTMLRAIGHARAQSLILGVSQLSCGLFTALHRFEQQEDLPAEARNLLRSSILPRLPVQDILDRLRLYQQQDLKYVHIFRNLFPAWNSALNQLQQEQELLHTYIPLLQQELARRMGLDPAHFFEDQKFNGTALAAIRPELAVLLQGDLFNLEFERLAEQIGNHSRSDWRQRVEQLLAMPLEIQSWRASCWELLRDPVYDQVQSFNKLAFALKTLTASRHEAAGSRPLSAPEQLQKVARMVQKGLYAEKDEQLKGFLESSLSLLMELRQENQLVPISVVRALRDVDHIVRIEQQPLSKVQQRELNFYILQMARLAGENG